MKLLIKEAFGYGVASACALVVDVSILAALVHDFAWGYLSAATTSFLGGMAVAYFLSVTLVFKQRRVRDRRTEFVTFAAIGGVGLALNAAVIFACVDYLGLHYLVAKCIAASLTFISNFILRRQLLFVRRSSTHEFI
jgi:putative flippase GtrA